jgi:hypothetical protein
MKIQNIAKTASRVAAGGAVAMAAYALAVRPWHLRWGTTRAEEYKPLPGDEIVPKPEHTATHAITIDASIADVWPWLVQIGQNRAGFYSYNWLENLAGCEIHNADRIVPEWQTLRVGDVVWLHPGEDPLPVIRVEPFKSLVLGGSIEDGADQTVRGGTWGFYLEQVDENTTRFIVRIRWSRKPGLRNQIFDFLLLEPAHFVMERKMMLGIKRRAEELARTNSGSLAGIESVLTGDSHH